MIILEGLSRGALGGEHEPPVSLRGRQGENKFLNLHAALSMHVCVEFVSKTARSRSTSGSLAQIKLNR